MNKKKIILIGGGGHCKSCIEVIESTNEYSIAGIIDIQEKIGNTILGYKIIGSDHDLEQLKEKYDYALITVGQIKSNIARKNIFEKLKKLGYELPVIIANTAIISKHSEIGQGTIIMHQAFVNSGSKIGENCIINSKALIEHDCNIGNHCHISTNAKLNGNVTIGNNCFVGSSSTFVNGLSITNNVFIGISSVIHKNLNESGIYIGNPIRKIR